MNRIQYCIIRPEFSISTQVKAFTNQAHFITSTGGCFVAVAWDCMARCSQPWAFVNSSTSTTTSPTDTILPSTFKITALEDDHGLEVVTREGDVGLAALGNSEHSGLPLWGLGQGSRSGHLRNERLYRLEGVNISTDLIMANLR